MEGANRHCRKVSGPPAGVKKGFVCSREVPITRAAFAGDKIILRKKGSLLPSVTSMARTTPCLFMRLRCSVRLFPSEIRNFRHV